MYQEANNGVALHCPVRALRRRFNHLHTHKGTMHTVLSAYYSKGRRFDMTANNISLAFKVAASALEYPIIKGIPIERINTHSLRSGGANALALAGYSDTQIQKMGRWRRATFKEYIQNELASFSEGISMDMKQKFGFVNVSGNVFSDIMDACINTNYSAPIPMAGINAYYLAPIPVAII